MVCGLLNNWSLGAFIGIALLYSFLDCMDGSVARACDLKSKTGAILDTVSDILFTSVAAVLVVFLMSQKYGFYHWKTMVVAVSLFFTVFVSAVGINYSHNDGASIQILDFVNDNTLLISPLLAAFAWWLVNRA
jgi:phosphatidylglycerophosphate synthase